MTSPTRVPPPIIVGIVLLAASAIPLWLIDLSAAPNETQLRFWVTLLLAVALWGVAKRLTFFRWLLLVLLGTGIVVSAWSFLVAGTIEFESALITLVQTIGLTLFFLPAANQWFAGARAGLRG